MLNNRRCFSQVMPMKKEQGIAWNKKWQLKNNVIGNGQLFFESFDTTPEIIDKMKRSPDSSTPNEFDNLAVKPIFDRSWCKCNNYATDLVFSVLTMSVTYKLKSELWHKEIKSCYSSFSLPLLGSFIPWCVWYSDNFLSSNHLGASLTKNLIKRYEPEIWPKISLSPSSATPKELAKLVAQPMIPPGLGTKLHSNTSWSSNTVRQPLKINWNFELWLWNMFEFKSSNHCTMKYLLYS